MKHVRGEEQQKQMRQSTHSASIMLPRPTVVTYILCARRLRMCVFHAHISTACKTVNNKKKNKPKTQRRQSGRLERSGE